MIRRLWPALVLVLVVGCAEPRHTDRREVTGVVTYKSQPVPYGRVTFISTANPLLQDSSMIRPDGTYTLTNAPIGKVKVILSINGSVDLQALAARGEKAPPPFLPADVNAKYMSADTTPLEVTVGSGDEKIDLEIK